MFSYWRFFLMVQLKDVKPSIQQKNTWLGVATLGFGVYTIIVGNITEGIALITSGLGLIFSFGS
jgi:hypothetical protein